MPLPSLRGGVAALLLLCASPLHAQHEDRIWGRVFMEDGEVHEGFIHVGRWRGAASWTDVLVTAKEIPEEQYQDWLDATRGGKPHVGTIELKGYRITWDQKHPSFDSGHRSGIRFGHLAGLTRDEEGDVVVVTRTRSGSPLGLVADTVTIHRDGGAMPHGPRMLASSFHGLTTVQRFRDMELVVESGGRSVNVRGRDVTRIEFAAAPAGTGPPLSPRLYGTVEDRSGRSFTGFVTWDRYQVLESYLLSGYWEDVPELANPWESDEYERSFRFSQIRALERTPCFARVTLKSDSVMELCSEPFERDPRPVQISDPALGMIEVEWDAVRILRFEPSPGVPGYGAFDGGRLLSGTVVTVDGEEIAGRIRWDADEEWSWELLQGSSNDVEFSIEFGNVTHIAREESDGARVTLRDGRSYHLTGGNDVDRDNRGIFIFSAVDSTEANRGDPEWRYVAWEDFREVRFHAVDAEEPGS